MDPFTAIGAAMAVGGFVGGLFDDSAQKKQQQEAAIAAQQNALSQQISTASQQQDNLRKQAATNDYIGGVRANVRNAQVAQANATAGAYNNGSSKSSGLLGGRADIGGQVGTSVTDLTGDYLPGQQIFDLNKKITGYQTQYNILGGQMQLTENKTDTSPWAALTQLGTTGVANGEKISNSASGIANLFKA